MTFFQSKYEILYIIKCMTKEEIAFCFIIGQATKQNILGIQKQAGLVPADTVLLISEHSSTSIKSWTAGKSRSLTPQYQCPPPLLYLQQTATFPLSFSFQASFSHLRRGCKIFVLTINQNITILPYKKFQHVDTSSEGNKLRCEKKETYAYTEWTAARIKHLPINQLHSLTRRQKGLL
jgi:hypothetical protein